MTPFAPGKTIELKAAELEECWDKLGGDVEIAYRTVGKLRAVPEQAVALLRGRLKPAPMADAQRIAQLIADLENKEFKSRELATKELEKLGEVAAPALHKALGGKLALEVRRRLELLLEKLEGASLPAETLRQVRAVEALEGIGGAEARRVLEALVTDGAAHARLTRE